MLDQTIDTLELMAKTAKLVPVLGATVEGALEVTCKILKYAKVCSACLQTGDIRVTRLFRTSRITRRRSEAYLSMQ
jgi:hypothetical protein